MELIIGLGNPGLEYKYTRHNIGFIILDKLAKDSGIKFRKDKISHSSLGKDIKNEIVLAKPETFMNLSGGAVSKLIKNYNINLNKLLIIYDDVDLDFGRIKFSFGSSSGGHKGVESVINSLKSKEFCRLRFGIGRNSRMDTSDFVLSRFRKEELGCLEKLIEDASQAAMFWHNFGIKKAMDKYN
ncbi:MAG: aminoacyl-tRNA hydrolase [Candidatus Omnitrophota bacterium]